MTGADIRKARATLGQLWGLNRPLHAAELARVLRLNARDPGLTIRRWEIGERSVSGPVSLAIDLMIAGAEPPDLQTAIRRKPRS